MKQHVDWPATAGQPNTAVAGPVDLLQQLLAAIEHYQQTESDGQALAAAQLQALVPQLVNAGIFTLFSPAEWISGEHAARRLIGLAAQDYLAGPHK